ncbi:hypothetical protein OVA11_14165 [Caulobacter sp. SL161]|uniref:hypothetical protein n=1 Tax=Caulobacter sp. SL161 TaxID=2995156 RepID=UPI002274C42A|nr:hypothetical protein [Caulobacter sp. SL161]MCY1648165.1 hypothetical protein [Caulobacter sp. SL161]
MRYVSILAGVLVTLSVVGAGWAVVNGARDAATLRACVRALGSEGSPERVAKACPAAIADAHLVAARASACDAALSARPENSYAVAAACSAPVKTVQAERDIARREAARLTSDLTNERLGQDAAIARASASAATLAERKARAVAAVQAAPRDGDGLVVCDADCLRARWATASDRP